jgi:hypothetical protein
LALDTAWNDGGELTKNQLSPAAGDGFRDTKKNPMKRSIEIKSAELLNYGAELTEKVQQYIASKASIINVGRAYTTRLIMSDNSQIFIHHTDKTVIVEK